ncbi:MAG: 2-C-methyl-D-erythritol 4-phosphate cytidylyltransferase [Flavobacteriales bacterium]|nr:2-C-methyl-D-erythritol 4-phosphate cytidylyltransferase [Flavobacteriales bacterium]
MKRYAIIVAGGSGQRMKSSIPKQFMELADRPVLMHTMEKFYRANASIELIVVLPSSHHSTWETLCRKHQFNIPHQIAAGGMSRFKSVKKGLEYCSEESIIAVHDGVRPLISSDLILKMYKETELKRALIPVCPVSESIRLVTEDSSKALDRSQYYSVQTPQCFSSELLQAAYEQEERDTFTDDASVVEALGEKVHLCEGEDSNVKLTSPKDLLLAEILMSR